MISVSIFLSGVVSSINHDDILAMKRSKRIISLPNLPSLSSLPEKSFNNNGDDMIFIPKIPTTPILPKLDVLMQQSANQSLGLIAMLHTTTNDIKMLVNNTLREIHDEMKLIFDFKNIIVREFAQQAIVLQQTNELVKLLVNQQQQQQMRFAFDGMYPMMPPLPYYPLTTAFMPQQQQQQQRQQQVQPTQHSMDHNNNKISPLSSQIQPQQQMLLEQQQQMLPQPQ